MWDGGQEGVGQGGGSAQARGMERGSREDRGRAIEEVHQPIRFKSLICVGLQVDQMQSGKPATRRPAHVHLVQSALKCIK